MRVIKTVYAKFAVLYLFKDLKYKWLLRKKSVIYKLVCNRCSKHKTLKSVLKAATNRIECTITLYNPALGSVEAHLQVELGK